MLKKLMAALFCVSLTCSVGACSDIQAQKVAISSESLLAVCEKAALQYINGDFGTPNAEVVAEIHVYDNIAYADMLKIRAAAQKGQTISAAENIAATTAIAEFQTFLINKKIITEN